MALTGSLDLFELMVVYTTGSILLSLIVWALLLLVAGIIGRMSMKSIIIIIATFLAVAAMGYAGIFAGALLFLFALWYMVEGILRKFNGI
jgi:hypothetical protein